MIATTLMWVRDFVVLATTGVVLVSQAMAATDARPRVELAVAPATAAPGERVSLDATLHTNGASVAGLQFDISVGLAINLLSGPNGRPKCTVNPAIDKLGTSFSFQPPGCVPFESCDRARVLVFSPENVDPIADGSSLFRCTLAVAEDASGGVYPLQASLLIVSDPNGHRLPNEAVGGNLTVVLLPGSTPKPTRTPVPRWTSTSSIPAKTSAPSPTPTLIVPAVPCAMPGIELPCTPGIPLTGEGQSPTPSPSLPSTLLTVSFAAAAPGEQVGVQVTLHTGGKAIAGVQTDIRFDASNFVPGQTEGSHPQCSVNPTIAKPTTSFAFQPPWCVVGQTCTGVRVLVFAADNVEPIADQSVLFSCTFTVAGDAPPGSYPITTSGRLAADPVGGRLQLGAIDGVLTVALAPGTSPGPSRTPTATPTATVTRTRMPTRTFTVTFTPLPTPTQGLGSLCFTATDCPIGFCVDGVCCETSSCPPEQVCYGYWHAGRCGPPDRSWGSDGPHPPHRPQARDPRDLRDVGAAPASESGCGIGTTGDGPRAVSLLLLVPIVLARCCRRATHGSVRIPALLRSGARASRKR